MDPFVIYLPILTDVVSPAALLRHDGSQDTAKQNIQNAWRMERHSLYKLGELVSNKDVCLEMADSNARQNQINVQGTYQELRNSSLESPYD